MVVGEDDGVQIRRNFQLCHIFRLKQEQFQMTMDTKSDDFMVSRDELECFEINRLSMDMLDEVFSARTDITYQTVRCVDGARVG